MRPLKKANMVDHSSKDLLKVYTFDIYLQKYLIQKKMMGKISIRSYIFDSVCIFTQNNSKLCMHN